MSVELSSGDPRTGLTVSTLPGWLAREAMVTHSPRRPRSLPLKCTRAAPKPAAAIEGAFLAGFSPFLGSVQSTSGTLSPRPANPALRLGEESGAVIDLVPEP